MAYKDPSITFDHSKGLTKQSFKDECDINKILARFQKTGALSHYMASGPQYGEITQATLSDAMNIVATANTMFEELPSSIRDRFKNDPGEFLDFVQDPKNAEEMAELGLRKSSPQKAPQEPETPKAENTPSETPANAE